jgi:hypothetical protein
MDITIHATTTSGVTMTGSSTQGIKTVLHPVSDLATAKKVYAALLGVWWPPSPTPMATSSDCFKTGD